MRTSVRDALFSALYGGACVFRGAATLCSYAAAGAVRLADLRAAIQREWENSGASEWENYIAIGLMKWELDFYPRFLRSGDRVLVIGCGTGRDLLALLQLGCRAEGLDVGPQCTATARQVLNKRGLEAPVYTGAIETIELTGRFDAFVFSWFCYSYIPQSETRIHVLRRLKEHLNPGGRILVTYVPAKTLPRRLPIRLARLVAWLSRSDWRPERGDVVHVADRGRYFIHYQHEFTREQLQGEARAASLRVVFDDPTEEGKAVLIA